MTVTAESIKEMFPEFADKSDSFINMYIDSAKVLICESMYGDRYCLALSYLTAHLMKISTSSGKEVSSSKVGDLARSYKVNSNGGAYNSTGYGQEFNAIKNSLINFKMRPIYGSSC